MHDVLNQFLQAVTGKQIEAEDSSNLYQCMDLAFKWCDALGIPRDTIRHLHAYEVFTSPNTDTAQYFTLVPNSPTNTPEAGDLVVFGQAVGPSGHICVATGKGDINSFESIDQNWDTEHVFYTNPQTGAHEPYTRVIEHSYNGVLGWLHPTLQTTSTETTAAQTSTPTTASTTYRGLDLTNTASVKTAIDTWADVAAGNYVSKNLVIALCGHLDIGLTTDVNTLIARIEQLKQPAVPAAPAYPDLRPLVTAICTSLGMDQTTDELALTNTITHLKTAQNRADSLLDVIEAVYKALGIQSNMVNKEQLVVAITQLKQERTAAAPLPASQPAESRPELHTLLTDIKLAIEKILQPS